MFSATSTTSPLSPNLASISCQAFGIGVVIGICCTWMVFKGKVISILMYLVFMGMFHFLEFLSLSLVNPQKTDHQSFLLDNGKKYYLLIIGIGIFEWFLFDWDILNRYGMWWGIPISIIGQVFRTYSMIECSTSFTHEIEFLESMKIIKTGPYSIVRHPSYSAYLIMVIGNQMVLGNWITIMIVMPSLIFFFFRKRIKYEEGLLMKNKEYIEYKKKIKWSGVPFC